VNFWFDLIKSELIRWHDWINIGLNVFDEYSGALFNFGFLIWIIAWYVVLWVSIEWF
jgi:hypothetical protein